MDVLRKELNGIYAAQRLHEEILPPDGMEAAKAVVAELSRIEDDCRVITDAAADTAFICGGRFAALLGLGNQAGLYRAEVNSSDEDEIYNRMHPEDLVEKRMLEYEFFRYVDRLEGEGKLCCKATCRLRVRDRGGEYIFVDNSTRILRLSPRGKIWLILCTYNLSPAQRMAADGGISPRLVDNSTGRIITLSFDDRRASLLTLREKQILLLIRDGKPSKQIADMLKISVHTVNRHRQNILEKLSVGNSVEAVKAATEMKLI